MAFDTFLDIPEVPGESTDAKMTGKMELYSFSWGASNPVTIGSATSGTGGGKVSLSSFNVMKKTDKASPKLFLSCCNGSHYPKGTVTMRKAGGTQDTFLKYEFEEVYVESVQWSGSSGGDDTPSESISFAFAKVTVTYSVQGKDGKMQPGVPAGWDQTTNIKA